ncbi:MAG TPA: subclass B3 metallo-beta-lactamase [Vicinamibacterales bacterium]|nr:subclass B3 metallo-beta-lactamase [Vicinamibacterales bacterium]
MRFVLAAVAVALLQTPTFQSDPPLKCDACDEWNKAREPFKVFGNTYYVGTDGLSALLVVGDRGLILLDGALPQSAALIDANIRKLGFKTEDVKLIVNSHGHYDHAGGINALQRASGATVAASPSTASALRRGENTPDDPQFGFGREANAFPAVRKVRVVKDGETLRVGNAAITATFTPGHTPGSTAWSWQSCEGGRCLNIVYADSLTAVAAPGFNYTADPKRVALFRRSITRVAELPCDIVISTHPSATGLDDKIKKRASLKAGEADPFVDGGCKAFAARSMKALEARIAEETKRTKQ